MVQDYSKYSLSVLIALVNIAQNEIVELKSDNADDKNKVLIDNKMAEVNAICLAMANSSESNKSTTSSMFNDDREKKKFGEHISKVKEFTASGPQELASFLDKLEMLHKLHVTDESYEITFVKDSMSRLSSRVFNNIPDVHKIKKFKDLKDWLRTTYDSQLSCFQLLSKAWDEPFDKDKPFVTYAQSIEEHLRTAETYILAKYKEQTKEEMTASNMLHLIGGMLMVEKLRSHCDPVYKSMAQALDKLNSASEVANRAEFYRTRFDDNKLIKEPADTFWNGRPHDNRNNDNSNRTNRGDNYGNNDGNGKYNNRTSQPANKGYVRQQPPNTNRGDSGRGRKENPYHNNRNRRGGYGNRQQSNNRGYTNDRNNKGSDQHDRNIRHQHYSDDYDSQQRSEPNLSDIRGELTNPGFR